MNEHLAFKNPGNVTIEQAATIGVGVLVCCNRIRCLEMVMLTC
jgi:hypothetical protein